MCLIKSTCSEEVHLPADRVKEDILNDEIGDVKDEKQGQRSIGCLLVSVQSIEDFRLVYWDRARVRDIANSLSQVDQTGNHCPCRVDDKTIEYDPAMKKI